MKLLKNKRWQKHPWSLTGMVEEISVHFLKEIACQNTTSFTDDLNGTIKDQEIIFDEIEKNGMRDPLLIVISVYDKTIRLESGNHRISDAIKRGYTHLPVATFVTKKSMIYDGNGNHYYDLKKYVLINKLLKTPYPYQIKLSNYLIKKMI